MLKIILNRLNPIAENILAEEKADFRKKRSTIEQILNCIIIADKHIEHGIKLYYDFVDFNKAFDRVWHEGLWKVMRHFNIDTNIIAIIENLYKKTNSVVLVNNKIVSFFNTSVEVR